MRELFEKRGAYFLTKEEKELVGGVLLIPGKNGSVHLNAAIVGKTVWIFYLSITQTLGN